MESQSGANRFVVCNCCARSIQVFYSIQFQGPAVLGVSPSLFPPLHPQERVERLACWLRRCLATQMRIGRTFQALTHVNNDEYSLNQ